VKTLQDPDAENECSQCQVGTTRKSRPTRPKSSIDSATNTRNAFSQSLSELKRAGHHFIDLFAGDEVSDLFRAFHFLVRAKRSGSGVERQQRQRPPEDALKFRKPESGKFGGWLLEHAKRRYLDVTVSATNVKDALLGQWLTQCGF